MAHVEIKSFKYTHYSLRYWPVFILVVAVDDDACLIYIQVCILSIFEPIYYIHIDRASSNLMVCILNIRSIRIWLNFSFFHF